MWRFKGLMWPNSCVNRNTPIQSIHPFMLMIHILYGLPIPSFHRSIISSPHTFYFIFFFYSYSVRFFLTLVFTRVHFMYSILLSIVLSIVSNQLNWLNHTDVSVQITSVLLLTTFLFLPFCFAFSVFVFFFWNGGQTMCLRANEKQKKTE